MAEFELLIRGGTVATAVDTFRADIGISLPGTGERPVAPVYVNGEKTVTLKGDRIAEEFQQIVDDYVRTRFGD